MYLNILKKKFGFISGHNYLSNGTLKYLRNFIGDKDCVEVINRFELTFSKHVGDGFSASFASGRMAFYAILVALGIGDGDEVVLTGFTCSVMANAILRVGATPIFSDVDTVTFGTSSSSVAKLITANTKAIVVQHTMGIPSDIEHIAKISSELKIFLIEDCALTFGSSLKGVKVGNWGDAAIFSTDHSKPINTIIGGIAYTTNLKLHKKIILIQENSSPLSYAHQKSLFKQLIWERYYNSPNYYSFAIFINRFQHYIIKKLNLKKSVFLENDYGVIKKDLQYPYPATLPPFLAALGIIELDRWIFVKQSRQLLLKRIIKLIEFYLPAELPTVYKNSDLDIIPLRFIMTKKNNYDRFLFEINKFIDSNWFWFKSPVAGATSKLIELFYNPLFCPNSELVCKSIINLPCNIDPLHHDGYISQLENALKSFSEIKNI